MRTITMICALLLLSLSIRAQQQGSSSEKKNGSDSNNQPKVSWNVNKQLDDEGNIIAYDSTYTWEYSTMDGETMTVDPDSVLQQFRSFFGHQFPSLWDNGFNELFGTAPQIHEDFFRNDFFQHAWQDRFLEMEQMFRRMDSLRNQFFEQTYPGLLTPQHDEREEDDTKL